GVHGASEVTAFRNLPPMPEQITEHLCRLTLMQCLPSLVEKDCRLFGAAITEIQERVGDHFASFQGGRFCSKRVAETLPWMQKNGACGVGQSSWGPTGFALFANETQAYAAMKQARQTWAAEHGLEFRVCKAQNHKAEIRTEENAGDAGARLKNF
ncbi:MAG TPA: GHMP kinase, partial [Gammaproteobacteria bacterium]|nr:GHMP kinase [Gammaproteobacteria bacterium]